MLTRWQLNFHSVQRGFVNTPSKHFRYKLREKDLDMAKGAQNLLPKTIYGGFHKCGHLQMDGLLFGKSQNKVDDLEVSPFQETSKYNF